MRGQDEGGWVDGAVKDWAHRLVGKPHRVEGEERERRKGEWVGTGTSMFGSKRGRRMRRHFYGGGLLSFGLREGIRWRS